MKRIFTLCLALTSLVLAACSDEETNSTILRPTAVERGANFLDTRDSTTYRTVRVGKQLWMAQNLHYALPGYSIDGAYTWKEDIIDKKSIKPDDEGTLQVMTVLMNDPQYEGWPIKFGKVETTLLATFNNMLKQLQRGRITVTELRNILGAYSPKFADELDKQLLKYADQPSVKTRVGKAHFEAAEKENGGYAAKYGFLYTHDAALAAVPEGWRLPTDEDWLQLEETLGVSREEAFKMNAWRAEGLADLLANPEGFAAEKAGANTYQKEHSAQFINRDKAFYYWTATRQVVNDSVPVAIIRQSAHFNNKVWRGTAPLKGSIWPVLYSVRCVKDL